VKHNIGIIDSSRGSLLLADLIMAREDGAHTSPLVALNAQRVSSTYYNVLH
jgi:hypothetical protein